LSGCLVITSEEDPVRADMDSFKRDMTVQQRKLDSIDEAVQKEKANVNASIDKIKEDMVFLSGKFEETVVEVKKIKNDMGLLQAKAVDSKEVIEMNSRLVSVQERFSALEKRLTTIDEKLAVMEQAKISSAVEEAKKDANNQEVKPDKLYNEAIKLIKDKDYLNAIEKFTRLISLFPNHDLVSNAQYWIGEIYYAQKDYERAVLEFNEVVKKYPQSKKVPAALLKQGMAFAELGNKKEARLLLETVMDKYPSAEEGQRAKKMLKTMK
jgi:tol-pal system protein YbgF